MWRRWPWYFAAIVLFHGAKIGLSDDEAYYWVLSKHPDWGYAFHPPMVAWLIAGVRAILGPIPGWIPEALVRFPAVACAGGTLALAMRWIERVRSRGDRESAKIQYQIFLGLISFGGLFGLAWMIVPDWPMIFFWTASFVLTWELLEIPEGGNLGVRPTLLTLATAGMILSKYSAVLGAFSAAWCAWTYAKGDMRKRILLAIGAGVLLAAMPIVYWNAKHEWGSLLYQLVERHEGAQFSLLRYGRFWAAQLGLVGIPLVWVFFRRVFSKEHGVLHGAPADRYAFFWALPAAAVFFVQPIFSDFKPHWAFIVWWPVLMAWMVDYESPGVWLRRVQTAYGLLLIVAIFTFCHYPIGKLIHLSDPKLDVTNDLYGWNKLPLLVAQMDRKTNLIAPVVGGRYQTAAQAAFALDGERDVTLLPRDIKARDEWPDLGVTDSIGPARPTLLKPIYFVTDNRYSEAPEFKGAECERRSHIRDLREGTDAKTIELWLCVPKAPLDVPKK